MNLNEPKTRKRIISGAYGPYRTVPCAYCCRDVKIPPFLDILGLCPKCAETDAEITRAMNETEEVYRRLLRGEPVNLPILNMETLCPEPP